MIVVLKSPVIEDMRLIVSTEAREVYIPRIHFPISLGIPHLDTQAFLKYADYKLITSVACGIRTPVN